MERIEKNEIFDYMQMKRIFIKFVILFTFLLTLAACLGSVVLIDKNAGQFVGNGFFMGFSPWTWGLVIAGALTLCAAFLLWLHFSKRLSPKGLTIFSAVLFAVCALLYVVTVCNFSQSLRRTATSYWYRRLFWQKSLTV